jgi:calcineurin-like phosphoesterase
MRILFIGDVFGTQGRKAIKKELPQLVKDNKIDFVIANAENTTHGRSLSLKHYKELMDAGVNFFTFGNHT